MLLFLAAPVNTPQTVLYASADQIQIPPLKIESPVTPIPDVPFYSQFRDIFSAPWQSVGCGITSLAMVINYYKPNAVSTEKLLWRGLNAGAYDWNAGWKYDGLIHLAEKYGLTGTYFDLSNMRSADAFDEFKNLLSEGPVILSVHNKFDPMSYVPHLIVIDAIKDNHVYYNDPAATGKMKITMDGFLKGWKRKMIVVRPIGEDGLGPLSLR